MNNMPEDPVLIAAVEGGGTSFVVAVAELLITKEDDNIRIVHRESIDSSHDNPSQTLNECASFFRKHKPDNGYGALGVGMFGPFGCNSRVKDEYGKILPTTPKKNWRGVDVLSPLIEACECESSCDDDDETKTTTKKKKELPVKIDTDVNAPALLEYLSQKNETKKNKKPISSLAYVTIGTGVGVGLVINDKPVHGRMHPEGGHVPVQPLPGDPFEGYSWGENSKNPFKGKHTVESMASSVALTERLLEKQQQPQEEASNRDCLADIDDDDHEIWDHAANALANLCVTLSLVTSVERIVLGGGIMKRNGLMDKVRRQTRVLLNGYLGDFSDGDLSELITPSKHGSDAGIMGALVLAQQAVVADEKDENEKDTIKDDVDPMKKAKQIAYDAGVWHGLLLGLSVACIVISARAGWRGYGRRR